MLLEQFYYGNIAPYEHPLTKEQKTLYDQQEEYTQELKSKVPKKIYRKIDRLISIRNQSCALECKDSFCEGFQMGMLLLLEGTGKNWSH